MVSFRYHVVSIVAVFLAIGLGILMGTTVVRQGVVEELRKRADGAVRTTHSLQKDVTDLRRQLQAWNNVASQLQHLLVTGELAGRAVVLVTSEGVDFSVVDLGGSRGKPAVDPAAFFVPLIDSLVESNHPVAVAETFDTSYDFVSLVRKDGSADGRVLTVDDADQMPGRVALVLGLRNILDSGAGGCQDFGVKPDGCGSIR